MVILAKLSIFNGKEKKSVATRNNLNDPGPAFFGDFIVIAGVHKALSGAGPACLFDSESDEGRQEPALRQIAGLQKRIGLIKAMQIFGVLSFLCCTMSMFALFLGRILLGVLIFGVSLIGLSVSLILSLYEVAISTNALKIELEHVQRTSGA